MFARFARRPPLARILIGAAFVLAIALRLRQAPAPMTFDEFASLYFSQHRFGQLWGWWMLRETNPPLCYST